MTGTEDKLVLRSVMHMHCGCPLSYVYSGQRRSKQAGTVLSTRFYSVSMGTDFFLKAACTLYAAAAPLNKGSESDVYRNVKPLPVWQHCVVASENTMGGPH
jgi:hypothetical protein